VLRDELAAEDPQVGLGFAARRHSSPVAWRRVAIARALVTRPRSCWTALSASFGPSCRTICCDLTRCASMLFVTHDVEALCSGRIIVMRGQPGRIHRDYVIDLSRPRLRSSAQFQTMKERILSDLDLELES
jgi:sulfonate transport system ATP-binding protein